MEMLSNGYGCIKKCSKALKQSLFDWVLHKFNSLLIRTMSDVPTASTSTASTSSESPASINPYMIRCLIRQDLDCTSDESDISSVEDTDRIDEESTCSNEVDCIYVESDDNMDDTSWSSIASSIVSNPEKSTSENSETEKSILKERLTDEKTVPHDEKFPNTVSPIIILVQGSAENEGEMNEIGIDLINIEEHAKRLKELEAELEFIESTEWMYRPIDSSIR